MKMKRLGLCSAFMLLLLKGVSSEPVLNFDPFIEEGLNEDLKINCTMLKCTQQPECNIENSRPLRDCSNQVLKRAQQCPKKLKDIGLLYYQGYNNLEFAYCNKDTELYDDLEGLMSFDCWGDTLPCLAPLHRLNETYQAQEISEGTKELCRDTMKMLEKCDNFFLDECKTAYQDIRRKHYSKLNCDRPSNSESSGGSAFKTFPSSAALSLLFILRILAELPLFSH